MNRSTPGLPVHHKLPEFTQTHAHRVGDAIQPSHPLPSPSPPAPNPSQHQGLFQRVNSSHEVPKYWSFSFSISPSNEHPGLISFRMGWLDLLAVQWTLKHVLQHHDAQDLSFSASLSCPCAGCPCPGFPRPEALHLLPSLAAVGETWSLRGLPLFPSLPYQRRLLYGPYPSGHWDHTVRSSILPLSEELVSLAGSVGQEAPWQQ